MSEQVTVMIASTQRQPNGVKYTAEELIWMARQIDTSNRHNSVGLMTTEQYETHKKGRRLVPFLDGYPYSVRAWVAHQDGEFCLWVSGRLDPHYEKVAEAWGELWDAMVAPAALGGGSFLPQPGMGVTS